MIDKMKSIVRENDTCVMATTLGNKPHCSLMSYVTDPECTTIYMVTHRQTRKYRNLIENPYVSLLIDTREGSKHRDRTMTKALTVSGSFFRLDDEKIINHFKAGLMERHPQLRVFLENDSAEVFAVRIHSFQLLEGISESSFVEVN